MKENMRILIVDDDPGIRDSYEGILSPSHADNVLSKGASLFDEPVKNTGSVSQNRYDLVITGRGQEGIGAVEKSIKQKAPFAAAFIDMKMPGIDGAETTKGIWSIDPDVKIVIVTAFSEYTPNDIVRITGRDDIFYLRKPFNPDEIRQFARALTNQWKLEREKELLSGQLERTNAKLEDMNKNLKEKVEMQTALIVQSEKMASVGILAAGVAHEINNPISFVKTNLSIVEKYSSRIIDLFKFYEEMEHYLLEGESEKIPLLLEDIRSFKEKQDMDFILEDMVAMANESLKGIHRVQKIVEDMKTFSRIDKAEFKHINLNELIDASLNIIWNELKYKAEVIKDYGDLPDVKCFAQKISQVLMNLLMNAVQAIEKKGTISIATRYVKDGRRAGDKQVEIRISDTGDGIPKNNLTKIFDPFFTTKPVGQGTGLGLSVTYDIVKAHGGLIVVESEEATGTTFIVTLPLEAKL